MIGDAAGAENQELCKDQGIGDLTNNGDIMERTYRFGYCIIV